MDKAPVKLDEAYRLVNPGVVVLVSVGDGSADNLFAVAWNMPARKDPPMVALSVGKRHHSWPFIERTGELGVNVPDAALADQVLGCGRVSGRDEPDKFARFRLTRQPAEQIKPPLVAEALANLECRVSQVAEVGGSALLVVQVLRAVAAADHFRDGHWQFDRGLRLLHHLGGDRFCTSNEVLTGRVPR